jgi:hypothetical protein
MTPQHRRRRSSPPYATACAGRYRSSPSSPLPSLHDER